MITVGLKGGLGNQLFQYALGRRLSLDHNCQLIIDARALSLDPLRNYALNQFQISQPPAKTFSYPLHGLGSRLNPLYKALSFTKTPTIINERGFNFDSQVLECADGTYLNGYWQSERYFLPIRRTLLDDLQLAKPLNKDQAQLAKKIEGGNSVSLHIRRGDYLTDTKTNSYHGLCDLDWYCRAANAITQDISNPHFFVFSDDYTWAKKNLLLSHPTHFIEPKADGQESIDMHLMSLCKHNIIANSSFSWWGAWLNQHSQKRVVAPANWFANAPHDTSDLIPSSWQRLA
jgi:hypothetical protein